MADTSTTLVIEQTDPLNTESRSGRPLLRKIINHLEALAGGSKRGKSIQVFPDGSAPLPAVGHITLASCAANTVIEINGAPFTAITGTVVSGNDEFDIDGTDAADATDLARAINASTHANISGLIKAVAPAADKLTAATAIAGTAFQVTLADGIIHRFVGQAGASTVGSLHFSIDTGDTACATDIAAQVNGYAPLTNKLAASSSGAVVTFRSLDGNTFTLTGTATVLAESGGATVTVSSIQKGALGNAINIKTLGVVATGSVAYVTPSGAQTVVINGVTVYNATAGATAALTAAAATAAINASTDALILGHVRALTRSGTTHIFAMRPGTVGNAITLSATGTGATASAARLASGTEASSGGVQATGTVTCASANAGDTVTVNGVVFTAHATTQGADQWQVSGNDTADGDSLVEAINNSTSAGAKDVIASNNAGVVTITARRGGFSGNAITLASSNGTRLAVSGARLTGGTTPSTVTITNATTNSRSIGASQCSNGAGGASTVSTITL